MRDYSRIVEAARTHYENLKADIENAANRIEHIRLTALAQEAHKLLTDLQSFEIGLVYSHVNNADSYLLDGVSKRNETEREEVLDLPEFRSPFTPPPAMQ